MYFKHERERIYAENEKGDVIAEVTFPIRDGVAVIDHTFVDDSLRGQGIAGILVQSAADQIRDGGYRIASTCSYASAWLEKHPEYSGQE